MASIVWGADQFIVSDFKYFEKREILSPDPRSNQVVVRCQYKVVWLSHPFGVWKIIDNAVANRIKDSEKILKTWFPAKARDFLKTVPKQLMVSQTTPEVRLALESQQTVTAISSKEIASNTVFDNSTISFALIAFFVAVLMIVFVIVRKCFGPKKITKAVLVPPSDYLSPFTFLSSTSEPINSWNSTL